MCPGGEGSGMQYADTCRLETSINQVICDCKPGFSGRSVCLFSELRYCGLMKLDLFSSQDSTVTNVP